ncbi:MAG TPA: TIGR03619 family F420-dependent LLM class oxidoreductase [Verrucomicrobiae bacterium]|jgi:probable F420-dependent oxidoreductase|nr:TIGR03619 family F420-dependent LLM class oxidoreductase [Verrucomicrobiae bacterium]
MTIRYRVGIMPGPWPPGRDGAAFLWTLCDMLERSDVDSIWLSDRLSSPAPVPEVMTTLAAIAARTSRLKFGPSVVVLPYRTPVVAAKEMATVDWLSGGRLFPAVGVGVELPREFDASGVPFAERGRRTDEAIRVMRLLWTQDEVTFQGDFYKLDRVSIFPKPWQTPPPIWIGGKSEAAMRRTARLGDGWIPSFITPDEMRAGIQKVHDLAAAAGREVPEDHFGTLINYAIADSEATALALAQPYVPRGRVDEATMRRCTAFGPAGTLIEKVEEYVKAGASKFILRPLCPPDRMLEQLALVGEQVCPEFHRRSS